MDKAIGLPNFTLIAYMLRVIWWKGSVVYKMIRWLVVIRIILIYNRLILNNFYPANETDVLESYDIYSFRLMMSEAYFLLA